MKHECVCVCVFTENELFLCTWAMPDSNIYIPTLYVGPNNKARYFQYNFQAYTSLADEVLCRSGCTVRNMGGRNDCSTVRLRTDTTSPT